MSPSPPASDREAGAITVSCRVRASMSQERADAYIELLRDCEAEGLIEGFKLHSWPEEVAVSRDRPERALIRGYESYREWADRAGVVIEPPFATRTRTSIVTEAEIDVLVLPSICLALYDDEGYLVGVYPHSDAEGTYTVEEAISRLRAGEVPVPRSTGPVRVQGDETCPDCHGLLVNGRGLYVCLDCTWVGSVDSGGDYVQASPELSGGPVDVSVAPSASEEPDVGTDSEPRIEPDDGTEPGNAVEPRNEFDPSDDRPSAESDTDDPRLPKN